MIQQANLPKLPTTVRDVVAEYAEKSAGMQDAINALEDAVCTMNRACTIALGAGRKLVYMHISKLEAESLLLSSAWRAIYQSLNLDKVLSSSDKKKFEQSLENPIPLTLENLTATLGAYWENPRYYVLKGLADVFSTLDPFYKSHSNFGIGKKGLPKRVIISGMGSIWGYGVDKMCDICDAMLQALPGDTWLGTFDQEQADKHHREIITRNVGHYNRTERFTIERFGMEVRTFANGNAHVYFNKRALDTVNRLLHEYYGDVLPDDSGPDPDKPQASTAVSKDLAFYPTPRPVIDIIMDRCPPPGKDANILEPSCGDGAILDSLREYGYLKVLGVEYHAGRASEARAKGHSVWTGNFLEFEPAGEGFDFVIQNPPFAGQTWRKHVEHAMRCVKPGGYSLPFFQHQHGTRTAKPCRKKRPGTTCQAGASGHQGRMLIPGLLSGEDKYESAHNAP